MLRIAAYAKINLGLRVLFRRPDGYHQIETRFQSISLADELKVVQAPGGVRVEMIPASGVREAENLVYRAARLLQAQAGRHLGARISIRKRIPVAAGLGGGSSDAVAALVALNQLWGLKLSHGQLGELASQLGSDLPFFLVGGFCRGSGRGERLERLPSAPSARQILIFKPRCRLGAAQVYAEFDRIRGAGQSPVIGAYANDLSEAAAHLCPKLLQYQRFLVEQQVTCGGLSGSGPTCYAILSGHAEAELLARAVREQLGGWLRLVEATEVGHRWVEGSGGVDRQAINRRLY